MVFFPRRVQIIHKEMDGRRHRGHRDTCAAMKASAAETEKMFWIHQKDGEKANPQTWERCRGGLEDGCGISSKRSIFSISLEVFKDSERTT